jgi:predicted HicB family RNase H-like nuclease
MEGRTMAKKPGSTYKILLTIPETLKKELQLEGKEQARSLNSYMLWVLANRTTETKPE